MHLNVLIIKKLKQALFKYSNDNVLSLSRYVLPRVLQLLKHYRHGAIKNQHNKNWAFFSIDKEGWIEIPTGPLIYTADYI